jgi:hypothetical protein
VGDTDTHQHAEADEHRDAERPGDSRRHAGRDGQRVADCLRHRLDELRELTMQIKLNLDTVKLVAAGVGVVGAGIGWHESSKLVHDTYSQDIFGNPQRQIDTNGDTSIIQVREPQGGSMVMKMVIGGSIATFVGGALAFGGTGLAASGSRQLLRLGAGAALFGLGAGAIAGAGYITQQYSGGDFVPPR